MVLYDRKEKPLTTYDHIVAYFPGGAKREVPKLWEKPQKLMNMLQTIAQNP